jgi:hypothetical protein|tara:strand:+ start:233 stop:496 length:264 start_codon:yes stop_codon:yes gene_type:complete
METFMDNVVKIELDTDQIEAVGIAYIKQCYETKRELLDGCELTDEDADEFKILEGMLDYVLTLTEQAEYYADKVPYTFAAKQTSLNL